MDRINALRPTDQARARVAFVAVLVLVSTAIPQSAQAHIAYGELVPYPMVFPVDGDHYFSDTFGAWRSHGKGHQGQDLMAAKGTPVVAASSGIVRYVNWTARSHLNPDRCCSVVIKHDDGWETRYLHLTNDSPGTDDGKSWGIAAVVVPGTRVQAGDLIGWVGDSGNAENTPSHLHFELIDQNGVHANPFEALLVAGGNPPSPTGIHDDDVLFSGFRLLRQGDSGDATRRLQEVLTTSVTPSVPLTGSSVLSPLPES